MRITKTITVSKEEVKTINILCNKCGEPCNTSNKNGGEWGYEGLSKLKCDWVLDLP